ncbi:hypothetical protein [Clostridium sp.]|uniref:hypothetical protein n=1 Tax=Clostridium sp. TaxID=1506 RepID=UPI0035A1553F
MDKVLRNVVNNIISLKRAYISDFLEFKELNESPEFNGLDKKVDSILESLKPKVSPDVYKSVIDIVDCKDHQAILCMSFYFRKGVIEGLTNLNFLSEIKDIAYIDSFGVNKDEGQ